MEIVNKKEMEINQLKSELKTSEDEIKNTQYTKTKKKKNNKNN